MLTLRECLTKATLEQTAIGHFNISDTEGFWAVFRAAQKLNLPVIIGVSEGERDFIGIKQIVALVKSTREEFAYPLFLNADHTHTVDGAIAAIEAGFDAVIIDGGELSLAENIKLTKEVVSYARAKDPTILVEGELGFIGQSSELIDELAPEVANEPSELTTPELAEEFVKETGVDLLAPAVGNVHGMLRGASHDPNLDLERIKQIAVAAKVPLVLHGASGNTEADVTAAITAGVRIVHINTELRLAYRDALRLSLQNNPDEVAPYKFMKPAVQAMEELVEKKLKLFNKL